MSDFDINAFLSGSISEPLATRPETPPEGKVLAKIADLNSPDDIATKWIKPPKGGRTWVSLAVPFDVVDEAYLAAIGRKKLRVMSDVQLDIDDSSRLMTGKGKNTFLGRIRAAVGQNTPATGLLEALQALAGQGPVTVTLKHQENKQDPTNPYIKVSAVDPAP